MLIISEKFLIGGEVLGGNKMKGKRLGPENYLELKWNDSEGLDIVADLIAAREMIRNDCGYVPDMVGSKKQLLFIFICSLGKKRFLRMDYWLIKFGFKRKYSNFQIIDVGFWEGVEQWLKNVMNVKK